MSLKLRLVPRQSLYVACVGRAVSVLADAMFTPDLLIYVVMHINSNGGNFNMNNSPRTPVHATLTCTPFTRKLARTTRHLLRLCNRKGAQESFQAQASSVHVSVLSSDNKRRRAAAELLEILTKVKVANVSLVGAPFQNKPCRWK